MNIMLVIPTVDSASDACGRFFTPPCGWAAAFGGGTNPVVTVLTKPHRRRPKETSPPI